MLKTKETSKREIIIRDAITAGILKAFGLEVTPLYDTKEVTFIIRGNVDTVLQKIAKNSPVGSRTAIEAIKTCRSAIYLFRQGVQR
jgi:hypothetical protein